MYREAQQSFLWLSCEYITICSCLLVCWFSDLTYTLNTIICFYLSVWCGEKWLLIFVVWAVSACAWIITLFQGQLTVFSPSSPRVMSCHHFVSLFFLSPPPLHIPASSLLATISPGLQLPSFPARSPWNPPRTINIVWEHSLGKHEQKRLISPNLLHTRNDRSHCDFRHWLTQHISCHDAQCFCSTSCVVTMCVWSKYAVVFARDDSVYINDTCEQIWWSKHFTARHNWEKCADSAKSSHLFYAIITCIHIRMHVLLNGMQILFLIRVTKKRGHNHTMHSLIVCFLIRLVI